MCIVLIIINIIGTPLNLFLSHSEGMMRTVMMKTGALAQTTIKATLTPSEMTQILKPRCLK